jgi:RHS repeat-associated protein
MYKPAFESQKGSTMTLTVKDANLVRNENGYYGVNGQPFNPENPAFGGIYILTTQGGIVYEIDAKTGDLLTATDANGNKLTFSDAGIKSSTGKSVTFERDAEGRIVSVVDPDGKKVKYEYDAKGDLVVVKDRENNPTQFKYEDEDRPHFLTEVIDPLGRSGVKTEYDDSGRLKQMVDANGKTVEMTYDPNNSKQVVLDARRYSTVYEYDQRGNIVSEIDPVGKITKRTYDEDNNLKTETIITDETEPNGYTTTYTYDSKGNQLTRTNPLGQTDYYTYNTLGQLLTSTTPLGYTTTYTYNSRGQLLSKTDANGYKTTYGYNSAGNLTLITEGQNRVTRFDYDSFGNLIRETDALNNSSEYTYDGNGNVLTQTTKLTTSNGVRTLVATKTYDKQGRVTSLLDAENNLTRFEYDAKGNQAAIIDALNRRTEYRYNQTNQLIETIFPDETPDNLSDNLRIKIDYDAAGNTTSFTDATGRVTQFKYDPLNRVTEVIYPDATPDNLLDNPRITSEYNQLGQLIASVSDIGIRTEYKYDATGRQTIVRNQYQGQDIDTKTTYDRAGRVVTKTNALNQTTKYVYDALDRVVETIFTDGTSIKTAYDNFGNIISKTDQNSQITKYEYDVLNRLSAVVDAKNKRTEYQYDEAGNLVYQKDANKHINRFEYDGVGRPTATIRPLGQRSFTVYEAGNISSITDFNGEVITYKYDQLNRLTAKKFVNENKAFEITYSSSGKPETYKDDRGLTTYQYNEQNKLLSRIEPDRTKISYTYNQKGQIETVTTPISSVRYTYDEWGRLDTVVNPDGVTDYDYDVVGNLISTTFANGIIEKRDYDLLNRLTSITNKKADGDILSSYTYTKSDKVGHRQVVTELGGRKVEYAYDELYRLTKETIIDPINGDRVTEYAYDDAGNRLTRNDSINGLTTYVYDDNDRLQRETTAGVTTIYTYDNNGNVIRIQNPDRQVNYDWNSENRLISGSITESAGITKQIQYQYDASGIRVASIVDGEETRYLVDANRYYPQVLEEYKSTGESLNSYTYGAGLLSQTRNGESSFYIYDGHSGVRQLSSETGQITDTYNYDAYGKLLNSTGSSYNSYLYQGEQFDSNLDLQYLRARYYDPNNGRFPSVDPFEGLLEEPMSRHRYMYGNNNPLTYVDPSGETAISTLDTSLLSQIIGILSSIPQAVPTGTLAIATGLLGATAAITAAVGAYSYWRNRSGGGILWTGQFDLAKIPSYGAPPGTPSAAFGLAKLASQTVPPESVEVAATGVSVSLLPPILPKSPVPLPTLSPYNVALKAPNVAKAIDTLGASNRGAFLGPFIFSTLKFTWPYILLDDTWDASNFTEGVLQLGFAVGPVSKAIGTGNGSVYDGLTWSPLDLSFAIGLSVPGS